MADEPEGAVAVAPETAPIVSEPAPEPDYKAQLAELQTKITQAEAENAKLGQQVASYRGIAGQKLDYEADSRRNIRELRELREEVGALLETASKDDDTVAQKVAALRQKRAQEEQMDSVQRDLLAKWQDLGDVVGDAYGLDFETQSDQVWQKLQTEPELQKAYALAYQARQSNNPDLLVQAKNQAREVRRAVLKATKDRDITEAKAAAKREAEEAAQERLRESGVLSMPGAKPAGGTAKSLEQLTNTDTRKFTLKQLKEHEAALDAAMGLR